ncbi:MAG: hypothetical protein JSS20_01220 [Proteobacteria bacterium]|nr:hypothetical protein [Pseudomonadota bacterium]
MKGKFGILLAGGFVVLSTLAAATGNFAVRFETAAREAQGNTQPTQQTATAGQAGQTNPSRPFAINRVALADGVTGLGQFQPRSSTIAPGTAFHIYFEPTNLTTRFSNGQVQGSMSVDILVRNARNETVATRDNFWQLPISRAATGPASFTQLYGDLTVTGLTFPDGRYQIVLRIHDDFAGTFVDRVIDVELRRPQANGNQRLSQTNVGATQQAPGR